MEMLYCEDNWQFTWGRMQYMMFVLNNSSYIFIPRLKRPSARAPEHRRQSSRLKFERMPVIPSDIKGVCVCLCFHITIRRKGSKRYLKNTWGSRNLDTRFRVVSAFALMSESSSKDSLIKTEDWKEERERELAVVVGEWELSVPCEIN